VTSEACVYYRFHPEYRQRLRVLAHTRKENGYVTVLDRQDKSLKIPLWMLHPAALRHQISTDPHLSPNALKRLLEFILSLPWGVDKLHPELDNKSKDEADASIGV